LKIIFVVFYLLNLHKAHHLIFKYIKQQQLLIESQFNLFGSHHNIECSWKAKVYQLFLKL